MCVDVCMLPKKAGICMFSCFPLFLTKIAYNLYSVPVCFFNLITYPGSHSIPVHRSLPYSFLQSSQQCFVKLLNFCQFVGGRGGINSVSVVLICKSTMSEMEHLLTCLQTLKIFAMNCLYMCFALLSVWVPSMLGYYPFIYDGCGNISVQLVMSLFKVR